MSRCRVHTKSGRCGNQALAGKHTCGQHPHRHSRYQPRSKHSASDYLGSRILEPIPDEPTDPTVTVWSTNAERATLMAEGVQQGASLSDKVMSEFYEYISRGMPDGIVEHDDWQSGAWK